MKATGRPAELARNNNLALPVDGLGPKDVLPQIEPGARDGRHINDRLAMDGFPSDAWMVADMKGRKLFLCALVALLAVSLAGCYEPVAYGPGYPGVGVGYGYGYGYGYGWPGWYGGYGYGYGWPGWYGGYGWRGGYWRGGYWRGGYWRGGWRGGYGWRGGGFHGGGFGGTFYH
jgi:hypothetical protein